ncbi:Protein of unknown function DUF2242 [Pseudoxanthomonas suwonensis 11-1]|uniref:DUF2242 domain-containing protein n=1 Tax=Pseudoxanthomonas suwonensis (strain 11-1) TaxID=743721 RepID=E6WVL6_PSEUU|nr:DUF2242 domain-containing protein [Pseudoxanthomonas suwonensis]ADV28215.1 Protein of unknown function DUF2242 [Pseudoxanthomonas suwonensis 11-1]
MPGHRSIAPFALLVLLTGCAFGRSVPDRSAFETFESSNTYSRSFDHSPGQTCEAARRALLSQGFVVGRAEADVVEARKYFQHDDSHEQVEFRAVCMPQLRGDQQTVVFVNAVQDRYVLRRNNTSASLGVSALGSVSLPIGSTEDSLVKVASETLQDSTFYKRFFGVLERFLPEEIERPAKPAAQVQPMLFPMPQYPQPTPGELPGALRIEELPAPPPATPAETPAAAPAVPVLEPAPVERPPSGE